MKSSANYATWVRQRYSLRSTDRTNSASGHRTTDFPVRRTKGGRRAIRRRWSPRETRVIAYQARP